jgi:hypothetical protein
MMTQTQTAGAYSSKIYLKNFCYEENAYSKSKQSEIVNFRNGTVSGDVKWNYMFVQIDVRHTLNEVSLKFLLTVKTMFLSIISSYAYSSTTLHNKILTN